MDQPSSSETKEMYIINLDVSRIFWFIAIGLLLFFFLFLLGYWVGSDNTVVDNYIIDDSQTPEDMYRTVNNPSPPIPSNNLLDTAASRNDETPARMDNSHLTNQENTSVMASNHSSSLSDSGHTTQDDHSSSRTKPIADEDNKDEDSASPTPSNVMSGSSDGNYIIQVGSHNSQITANEVLSSLQNAGYNAFINTGMVNDRTYHRIRIGYFSSQTEADKARKQMVSKLGNISGIENAIIIKLK